MTNWKVIFAKFNSDYSIDIKFADGLEGTVKILQSKLKNGFAPLKNKQAFLGGYLDYGAITWNINGQILDLEPDTVYEEIKGNNGVYILGYRTVCKD